MTSDPHPKRPVASFVLQGLPAVILLLLVMALIVSWIAKDVLHRQVGELLDHQAESLAHATQIKLDTVREATRALANNQLLVNALVDTVGRDNYLPAFFRSLRLPGPNGATISLTDYRGRIIASTSQSSNHEDASWLPEVMEGREYFHLSSDGVTIAIAVKYAGKPEGTVVVQYPAERVGECLRVPSTARAIVVVDRDGTVLHSTKQTFAVVGQLWLESNADQWMMSRTDLPEYSDLGLVAAIPDWEIDGSLVQFDRILLFALILDLVVLVIGVLVLGRTDTTHIPKGKWWLPTSVAMGAAVVTGFTWIVQTNQEAEHIDQVLQHANQTIASNVRSHLQYRVNALQRMALRWSDLGKPERSVWEHDAASYVDHFGDFQALEWIDASNYARWIVPLVGNEQALNLDLGFESKRRAALEAAKASNGITMTNPINLVQGGKGFLVYCPIYRDQIFEGFILGVFRFDRLLEHIRKRTDQWNRYQPSFKVGGEWVLRHHEETEAGEERLIHHYASTTLYGVPWTIDLAASDQLMSEARSFLKSFTLAIGLAVGVLLVVMTRQAQVLRWHAVKMVATNQKLETEVAERKQAEQALQQRAEELERSNQELDDFAYVASHDLKEPLRGIHNYATFLIEDYEDKIDEDGVHKLHTLTRLSQRMEGLIDALLHFSRVGRVDLATEATDLNQNVANVIDSLHVSLNEQGVEVRIPKPLPTIHCDAIQVGEIFNNLITNAMKYNDKPEKWIEIGYTQSDGHSQTDGLTEEVTGIHFYVRDNGIGIQEKHLASIFRIFKRLNRREKFGGGTGVGLTIVKKIVERHGGQIWVESQFGQGTTFHFTLQDAA